MAFVCSVRIPDTLPSGFFPGPPDLAIEIRSPDDRLMSIEAKIEDYLRLGVQVVWDVNPATETVIVHRPSSEPQTVSTEDVLTEPGLLPDFSLPVREIFAQ